MYVGRRDCSGSSALDYIDDPAHALKNDLMLGPFYVRRETVAFIPYIPTTQLVWLQTPTLRTRHHTTYLKYSLALDGIR